MSTEKTSGLPLSLVSPNIWKGTNKTNGQLEAIRDYYLKVGFAALVVTTALQAELTAAGRNAVPFGNAVWYDRNLRTTAPHKVYAGVPTASGAVPKLAGILTYDPALSSLQPVESRGVLPYNKATIIKRGFLRYKTGKAAAAGAAVAYADINDATMCMFVENSTGDPVFAAPTGYGVLPTFTATTVGDVVTALSGVALGKVGVPTLANCTYVGKIIELYPEDESVLVEVNF